MTMDDQIQAQDGFDGADPKTRFRSMMRAKGIKMLDLIRLGYDSGRMSQLLGGTQLSSNDIHELQQLCAQLDIDFNYVLTGVIPDNLSDLEKARLRTYRLLEKFCEGLWMEPRDTTSFITYAMNRIESKLSSSEFALYKKGIPKTLENVEEYFRDWNEENGIY